jgi:malate dehydrogenase
MGFIAVVGAGAVGGALARTLAVRDRVAEVRLIDPHGQVAAGKALDIMQSGPVEPFSTRVTSAGDWMAASGADVIVLADAAKTGQELAGETGLALLRQLVTLDTAAPIVLAGAASARELIARGVRELRQPRARLLGSAPAALESALRAVAGVLLDTSGTEIVLRVVGVPPGRAVVAWEAATASGLPLSGQMPSHVIGSLGDRIPGLWPPGPYALASAAARVVEAIVRRGRGRHSCFVALDAGASRTAVAAMPVELGQEGIRKVVAPVLTPQEQTRLENALED